MGFSFYTSLIAHGCSLHEKRRGNYTVKCKGHPEYHRGIFNYRRGILNYRLEVQNLSR
uniref:Uncharacterized protein n=1 Tax=Nelumbo nucifera TaxID=4432 RepID=A0A822Y3R5_NELNU|nr:TPA_asm: hypothetical protein HUJ06_028678 [Nelumbo nucifera]